MALVHAKPQSQKRAKLDFANGIRSMMRQDPDVILVGEVRDAKNSRNGLSCGNDRTSGLHHLTYQPAIGAVPAY